MFRPDRILHRKHTAIHLIISPKRQLCIVCVVDTPLSLCLSGHRLQLTLSGRTRRKLLSLPLYQQHHTTISIIGFCPACSQSSRLKIIRLDAHYFLIHYHCSCPPNVPTTTHRATNHYRTNEWNSHYQFIGPINHAMINWHHSFTHNRRNTARPWPNNQHGTERDEGQCTE